MKLRGWGLGIMVSLLAGPVASQPVGPQPTGPQPTPAVQAENIAELFVEEQRVLVRLEATSLEAPWLRVAADDGVPISPRVLSNERAPRTARDPVTGEPLFNEDPEGAPTQSVRRLVLEYALDARPQRLRIAPPERPGASLGSEAALSLGLAVEHLGVPVMGFHFLERPAVLDLDWQDPWYSRFRSPELVRRYLDPVTTYLYVEPYEVRLEVVSRLLDLAPWLPAAVELDADADTRRALLDGVAQLVGEHVELTVDGEPVEPVLDRVHLLERTEAGTIVLGPTDELDRRLAFVGVILSVPTPARALEVAVAWDLFSERVTEVPLSMSTGSFDAGASFTPEAQTLSLGIPPSAAPASVLAVIAEPPAPWRALGWRAAPWLCGVSLLGLLAAFVLGARGGRGRFVLLAIAVPLSLLAGGLLLDGRRAAITEQRAAEVLTGLLRNVYAAFDFRDEERIYDALAGSVSGELLTDTYLEVRQGLELANQGGARTRLEELDVLDIEVAALPGGVGFRGNVSWTVRGSVEHWGHLHRRTNRYDAEVTVLPVHGRYRLTALSLVQELRL